ncbi:type-F conjugative transfer system pilin assembly protein TrbC [Janthinobacterium sp. PSPC3-1]|uniref:type-F conjugative transfer system pilin assembly protein TrbC n=1 Tax=Janthinobacterium sp. PSPC3-1 TaxID=2804653 RepID=UPI003CF13789
MAINLHWLLAERCRQRVARPGAAGIAAVLLSTSAIAQPVPQVTQADIARAQALQPVITEQDIARAIRANPMPPDIPTVPGVVTPQVRVDALPQPHPGATIDLAQIAQGFEAAARARPGRGLQADGDQLLVFVTFAMPDAALKALVQQAAAAGATLLLRGLEAGSLVKTAAHAQQIMGTHRVALQIDPQAFDRYAVRQAPTFVLVPAGTASEPCGTGSCVAPGAYARVAGDVSLDYALTTFQARTPRFAGAAARLLARMGK